MGICLMQGASGEKDQQEMLNQLGAGGGGLSGRWGEEEQDLKEMERQGKMRGEKGGKGNSERGCESQVQDPFSNQAGSSRIHRSHIQQTYVVILSV